MLYGGRQNHVAVLFNSEPARGNPATDDTEFRIAYDVHNLYIAFRCYDAEPNKIINRMTRRGDIYASDVISFFIDPHHDHRTGYKFATNPAGVQSDNYRYEDTQRDSNWKGIWWVESILMNWVECRVQNPVATSDLPTSHINPGRRKSGGLTSNE